VDIKIDSKDIWRLGVGWFFSVQNRD